LNGYLVDTNIPSELTRDQPDPQVELFLNPAGKSAVYLSVLTIGEICKGIANLPPSRRRNELNDWLDYKVRPWFSGRTLPVTEQIAERWGHLAGAAKKHGMTLAVVDGIIAATAVHHRRTLVTRNVKDFDGLGIDILNPFQM